MGPAAALQSQSRPPQLDSGESDRHPWRGFTFVNQVESQGPADGTLLQLTVSIPVGLLCALNSIPIGVAEIVGRTLDVIEGEPAVPAEICDESVIRKPSRPAGPM